MPKLSLVDKGAKVTTTECRRRKEQALAELREMEVQQKRGELVPVADVRAAWATILRRVRDGVMRIPDACAPAVVASADARQARAILVAECESILRNLTDDVGTTTR